jgi:predicted metalloprotease with PDZ domain
MTSGGDRMSRPAALLLAIVTIPLSARAQHPYHHFTDAVEMRFARSQPIVSYRLRVDSADLSGFAVEMRIRNAPDTVRLAMAANPEYDDRYWRYLEGLRAETASGVALAVREDSAVWRVVAPGGHLLVQYRIRLPTPPESPRAAWQPYLTPTGGLMGGLHAFLYIVGATLTPSHVALDLPASWRVATGLEPTSDPRTYFAPTVDVLVDSPIFAGRFHDWRFAVDGVPHRVVYWDAPGATAFDTSAFVDGLARIARQAVALFGRPPYREYTFLMQDGAYGALEHRNSVTIGAPSASLAGHPRWTIAEVAHEFTHTWNLMRIRPEEYGDVDYRTQKPVAVLWFSEGLTMHYADLFQRQAGLPLQDSTRIAHLESLISRYLASPGNARFSAERISRVAYNAEPGALGDYGASVHLVGELLGTVLDLVVRDATAGRRSMDDVMRLMLERHSAEQGFSSRDVERAVSEVCGCSVRGIFDAHVRGATSIEFDRWLGLAGLRAVTSWAPVLDREGRPATDLRVRAWLPPDGGPLRMIIGNPASAWGRAGLHTHDRLVSVNGQLMTTWPDVHALLTTARIGDTLRFEVARPIGVFPVSVVLSGYEQPVVRISELPDASARQRAVRAGWLAHARALTPNADQD